MAIDQGFGEWAEVGQFSDQPVVFGIDSNRPTEGVESEAVKALRREVSGLAIKRAAMVAAGQIPTDAELQLQRIQPRMTE